MVELFSMNTTLKTVINSSRSNNGQNNTGMEVLPMVPASMFALGVFGNGMALIMLSSSSKDRKRTIFYKLARLLVSVDLTSTLALSPITLLQYAHTDRWYGGQALCHYYSFMMILFGNSTMFIVTVMTLERYLALVHPYVYKSRTSQRKLFGILIVLLMVAVVMASLPVIGIGSNVVYYPNTWCFFNINGKSVRETIFVYLYGIIGLTVILFLVFSNFAAIKTLMKMKRTTKFSSIPLETNVNNMLNREGQMIIFLAGVTGTFIVCWAPLIITVIICQATNYRCDNIIGLVMIRMASFNQIMDPWVYILLRRELFLRVLKIAKKSLCLAVGNLSVSEPSSRDHQSEKNSMDLRSVDKIRNSGYLKAEDKCGSEEEL